MTEVTEILEAAGFDLVVVKTPGIGQGDAAIVPYVDFSMYVMTPEFGAASQLEKIDMLDFADAVAINKFERRGAMDAMRDVGRLSTRVAIPIWRDPWMVVGSSTFTGDLVMRLGLANVFADHADRYPHVDLPEIDRDDVDLVLLPDEPYPFTKDDGPEAFDHVETRLVSGRRLTWYGPSLVEAHAALAHL